MVSENPCLSFSLDRVELTAVPTPNLLPSSPLLFPIPPCRSAALFAYSITYSLVEVASHRNVTVKASLRRVILVVLLCIGPKVWLVLFPVQAVV